jgi:hypothetical protein
MKRQPFAAGMFSVVLSSAFVLADNPEGAEPIDQALEQALRNPQSFMFSGHSTSQTAPYDGLVITSARGKDGKRTKVTVYAGTMQVFRADATIDDFTKQGGWYWTCDEVQGKSQFVSAPDQFPPPPDGAGPLIMVVRQQNGDVDWYALTFNMGSLMKPLSDYATERAEVLTRASQAFSDVSTACELMDKLIAADPAQQQRRELEVLRQQTQRAKSEIGELIMELQPFVRPARARRLPADQPQHR